MAVIVAGRPFRPKRISSGPSGTFAHVTCRPTSRLTCGAPVIGRRLAADVIRDNRRAETPGLAR